MFELAALYAMAQGVLPSQDLAQWLGEHPPLVSCAGKRHLSPMPAPILTLTDTAKRQLAGLMASTDPAKVPASAIDNQDADKLLGLRVGVRTTGCSGNSYFIQYATQQRPLEEVIEVDGVSVFVEPTAVMFLIGSVMDYKEERLFSGFVFQNPNETARCGCGESFTTG